MHRLDKSYAQVGQKFVQTVIFRNDLCTGFHELYTGCAKLCTGYAQVMHSYLQTYAQAKTISVRLTWDIGLYRAGTWDK